MSRAIHPARPFQHDRIPIVGIQPTGRLALIGVQAEPVDRVFRWGWSSRGRFTAISWPPLGVEEAQKITCANWPLSSFLSSSRIGGDCGCCRAAAGRC